MKNLCLLVLTLISTSLFSQYTFTSVKDGNWSDPTVWDLGVTPCDTTYPSVIINHNVTLDVDCGHPVIALTVNSGGSLNAGAYGFLHFMNDVNNSGSINLVRIYYQAAFNNYGTLSVDSLGSYFSGYENYGTTTVSSECFFDSFLRNYAGGVFTSNAAVQYFPAVFNYGTLNAQQLQVNYTTENTGTLNATRLDNYALCTNSGTIHTTGDYISHDSLFNMPGGQIQVGGSFENADSASYSMYNAGDISVNGSFLNQNKLVNAAAVQIYIGGAMVNESPITNGGQIQTGGDFTNKSDLINLASGNITAGNDFTNGGSGAIAPVTNYGSFTVGRDAVIRYNFYSYDFFHAKRNFTNYAYFFNYNTGMFITDVDFLNESSAPPGASFTEDGFGNIYGDFTNKSDMDGNGRLCVWGVSTNNGVMTGTFDFCDKSGDSLDVNTGTFGLGLTVCSYPCTVGLDPSEEIAGLVIAPNPFNGSTTLSLEKNINGNFLHSENVSVYNTSGEEVTNRVGLQLQPDRITLDCQQLSAGIYFVQLRSGDKVWRGKMVVSN